MRQLRHLAAAAVLVLAPAIARAAGVSGIINRPTTTSDPNALQLTGGTMTDGAVIRSTGSIEVCGNGDLNCVVISSGGVIVTGSDANGFAAQFIGAEQGFGHIVSIVSTGPLTGVVGLVVATSTDVINSTVAQMIYDAGSGDVLVAGPNGYGEIKLHSNGQVEVHGGGSGGVTLDGSGGVTIGASVSITTGKAACYNASRKLSSCTSVVDAGGNCTCP